MVGAKRHLKERRKKKKENISPTPTCLPPTFRGRVGNAEQMLIDQLGGRGETFGRHEGRGERGEQARQEFATRWTGHGTALIDVCADDQWSASYANLKTKHRAKQS